MQKAQRQSPSLHPPQGAPKLPETNSRLDKNWRQRHHHTPAHAGSSRIPFGPYDDFIIEALVY
jgi:hypothetical protein